MLTERQVIDALRAHGFTPKLTGREWHCGCPCCGIGTNRLRVHVLDGTLITACRQCDAKGPDIWRALGLLSGAADTARPRRILDGFTNGAQTPVPAAVDDARPADVETHLRGRACGRQTA